MSSTKTSSTAVDTSTLKTGDRVFTHVAFTSLIGTHFAAGHGFTVTLAGGQNVRLAADLCGSVVWLADGVFATADRSR